MSEREEKIIQITKILQPNYICRLENDDLFHEKGTKKAKRQTQVGRSVLFAADLIVFHIS